MKREIYKEVITSSFLIALVVLTVQGRPRYIECSNTLECGLGYCCVLGNGRYSLPRCLPLGKVNDECRPIHHPLLNVTVSYPDGESVELTHVYSTICPCQAGLYCSDKSGYCHDPLEDGATPCQNRPIRFVLNGTAPLLSNKCTSQKCRFK